MSILEYPLDSKYRKVADAATTTDANEILKRVREIRAQDDSDIVLHTGACEAALREKCLDLIKTIDIEKDDSSAIWSLLDAVHLLCDNGLCEPAVGFHLTEDLLDSQTIKGSLEVFRYMETTRERTTKINFKPKKQPILRCCNELLRRLSRAEDIIFCGRVYIYMFQFFALSDKSSFNLRGEFHVENVTTYDEQDEDTQMDNGISTPLQENNKDADASLRRLYPVFWSMQSFFSSPPSLFAGNSMQSFKEGIKQTLECFSKIATHSAVSSSTPNPEKRGQKRSRDGTEIQNAGFNASTFNPKYLTNRDLFALEVQDIDFRRHVLVQALILLDFLLSLTIESKAKLAVAYPGRSSPIYDKYTFSEEDKAWALDMRKQVEKQLEDGNGTEGRYYLRMVNMVISRDWNWVTWKIEGCPYISKPPVATEVEEQSQKSLEKVAETSNAPLRVPKGSDQLVFLSNNVPLEELRNKRAEIPTLEQYYEKIQREDLDLEFADTDQEKREIEERKAGQMWRALRSAKGRRFQLCEDLKNGDGALVGKVKGGDDQEPKEQPTDQDQMKVEDAIESAVEKDVVKMDA